MFWIWKRTGLRFSAIKKKEMILCFTMSWFYLRGELFINPLSIPEIRLIVKCHTQAPLCSFFTWLFRGTVSYFFPIICLSDNG